MRFDRIVVVWMSKGVADQIALTVVKRGDPFEFALKNPKLLGAGFDVILKRFDRLTYDFRMIHNKIC